MQELEDAGGALRGGDGVDGDSQRLGGGAAGGDGGEIQSISIHDLAGGDGVDAGRWSWGAGERLIKNADGHNGARRGDAGEGWGVVVGDVVGVTEPRVTGGEQIRLRRDGGRRSTVESPG